MNNLAPFMAHDDQHVEQAKGHRGNDKEIDRDNAVCMVLEERSPGLGRLSPGLGTILPDGCRRSIQSQFGQFVSDPRAAPSRVEGPHPADELNQSRVLSRTPATASGLPSPERLESRSLPADERFGPEDDQGVSPIGPTSHEQQPEIPVRRAELGPARLPFEHHELMAQRQNFQGKILSRSEERKRLGQNDPENGQHGPLSLIANHRHTIISQRDGFSATHSGQSQLTGSVWPLIPPPRAELVGLGTCIWPMMPLPLPGFAGA